MWEKVSVRVKERRERGRERKRKENKKEEDEVTKRASEDQRGARERERR